MKGKGIVKKLIAAAASMAMCFTVPLVQVSAAAPKEVERNTVFTTPAQMTAKIGTGSGIDWSPLYLTDVEYSFWNFSAADALGGTSITSELVKDGYRNLEMLLDDGYTYDYNTLSAYCADYLTKKSGVADSYYSILHSCLDNPYLLNRPEAVVTATTYNGRDYSKVFDADYYYKNNPDLQKTVGSDPAALLKNFVECGIAEGRQGNASFNVKDYARKIDTQSMETQKESTEYAAKQASWPEPVGKYSYSWANYYGLYLGHYDYSSYDEIVPDTASDAPDDSMAVALNAAPLVGGTLAAQGIQWTYATGLSPITGTARTGAAYTETNPRSVYTNEPVSAALANQRPLAVMFPTDTVAQPSYGIGNADVLYEIMEESGISRQMGIIQNWQGLSRIGNLRSCRLYYLYAAREWDPILIHFGGVVYMKGTIDSPEMTNISGTYEYGVGGDAPGSGYFFRTSDRSAPHNAYISASSIIKASSQLGYPLNLRADYYNKRHFLFANGVNTLAQYGAGAVTANNINLAQVFGYTKSALTYNAADGLYYKTIHGVKQVDALTGKQLTFANVIVQNTIWHQNDKKGYLSFDMLGTTQDGYYFTRGKAIHIRWWKTQAYEPTRYFDDAGNEIQLNTGKTYIAIAQAGKNVTFN